MSILRMSRLSPTGVTASNGRGCSSLTISMDLAILFTPSLQQKCEWQSSKMGYRVGSRRGVVMMNARGVNHGRLMQGDVVAFSVYMKNSLIGL